MQTQPCEEHRVMLIVAAFVAGALLLFLFGIDRYPRYGLDESIYVSSARSLIDGTSIWTPDHPPLGKSLIAVGIKFAGDRALGWPHYGTASREPASWDFSTGPLPICTEAIPVWTR